MNKEYLENSKTAKEKQDIVNIEVNMNEKQCGNKAKVEDNMYYENADGVKLDGWNSIGTINK